MSYFPLFVNLTDRKCLVVGGGSVAVRKVRMLLDFGARVSVVSKDISNELLLLSQNSEKIFISQREFHEEDILEMFLVIAATNDNSLNRQISQLCKTRNIQVNVVDKLDECSFILPAYVKEKNVVAAFSSGGNSPVLTQYLKAKAKEYITEEIGEINECLGSVRKEIQNIFPTEAIRKEVFETILQYALSDNSIPTEKEIEIIISQIKKKYEI